LAKHTTVSYLLPDMACDKQWRNFGSAQFCRTECGMLARAVTDHWLVGIHAGRLKAPKN